MAENFVTLDLKTYQSLQQEVTALRHHVVYLEQARLREPYGIARQKTLFNVIGTIRASLDLKQIFQQTAREIRQLLDADRVGIFQFDLASEYMEGEFISEDVREGYNSALAAKVRDRCFAEKYIGYYEKGRVQAIADIYNAGLSDCHIQILSRFQIKANLIVPLVLNKRLWGLLCIHQCSHQRIWKTEEIEFIQQIALHLDVAIYQAQLLTKTQEQANDLQQINKILEKKFINKTAQLFTINQTLEKEIRDREQAEEELQKLNEELEARVAERTRELQASEARFQNLAANVPGVIYQFCIEPDGCRSFPYVSPAARSLLELEPSQFGKVFDIVDPEYREELERQIIDSAQKLEIFEWEGRVITTSGKVKWIRVSARPGQQPDGAIVWDGLFTDITDRRQAELERDRFFNLSGDLLCIAGFDGYFKRVNPAFEITLGYTVEELLSQTFINFIHPEDREATLAEIEKIREGSNALYFENRYRCKDGSYKWLSWTSVFSLQDQVIYATARDITDRKKSEEALQISEERFRLVVEQTGQLIYDYNLVTNQINWCGAIEEITGYSLAEFQNFDLISWEEHIHPEDRQLALEMLDSVQKNGTQYHANYRFRQKNCNYIYVDDNGVFIKNENGDIYRMLGTMGNITPRKQAEIKLIQKTLDLENALRELQQTQTQLVQSEKMSALGQLVAGIAHEINNPVNFIFGNLCHANEYVKALLAVIESYQKFYPNPGWEVQSEIEAADLNFLIEDFPKLIASMQIGAERIREIIAALRNFSRIDESAYKMVDIHQGIESTLMILQNRIKPKPNSPGIQVIKNYGNLPQVECYPGQLNQVFMNILVNAIDALEEREKGRTMQDIKQNPSLIVITTKVVQSESQIRIKISDNGPGIPKNVQHRIFDPFFTTKGLGKGTGLGMSISYQIITEKHHGTIECVSAAGKGAEFIINLPTCLKKS